MALDYDINVTRDQAVALGNAARAWPKTAEVGLAVDDRMLLAEFKPEASGTDLPNLCAWDTDGSYGSAEYLRQAPLDPTGSKRPPRLIADEDDTLELALEAFKAAAARLSRVWGREEDDSAYISGYPDYLPSFDEFVHGIMDMRVERQHKAAEFDLPELPAVGTVVRARYQLDAGGQFTWPEGWSGEIVVADVREPRQVDDDGYLHVQAHRYIPGAREWDNCRMLSVEDGHNVFFNQYGYAPPEDVDHKQLLALALFHEFEVM